MLSLLLISSESSTDIINAINAINNKATDVPRSIPLRSVGEELNLEKLARMEQLKQTVNKLNCRIDDLLVENSFWKDKLETVNQLRSEKLLDKIKKEKHIASLRTHTGSKGFWFLVFGISYKFMYD